MIEIEVINACLATGYGKDISKQLNGIDSYCVIKIFGRELGRTELAMGTYDPIWHEKFVKSLHDLTAREILYNRPFYLESVDVEIYDASKAVGDKHVKMFETRVPISNIGQFKSYRLLRCAGSGAGSSTADVKDSLDENRIFVRINRLSNVIYDKVSNFKHPHLCDVCPTHSPLYRHLYMDYSWSPNTFTYTSGLPGPSSGEKARDRYHHVEVRLSPSLYLCVFLLMARHAGYWPRFLF